MRIIETRDRRAIDRLFAADRANDRAFERRVSAIVEEVRTGGDRALLGFARRFDGLTHPLEVSRDEMNRGAAAVAPDVRRAIRQAARNIARVAARQVPKGG